MFSRAMWPKYGLMCCLAGLCAGLCFVLGTAWYIVATLTRPTRRSRFARHIMSPFEFRLPAENVVFATRSGEHQVSGWFVPYPDATSTIIICPGFRTGKAEVLGIAHALWQVGHNILVFEYYGHGADVRRAITLGYQELNDFFGAVAYARWRAPHARLGVLGYSMGAAIAIMGSARMSAIEAVVADSAFATHRSAVHYHIRRALHLPATPFLWCVDHLLAWRAGYRFHQVEPVREIARIAPRPVLLIHGGKDSMVDPTDASLLYEAASGSKTLWIVPDAEHCGAYFVDRGAYVACVAHFFARHLQTESTPSRFHGEGGKYA